MPTTPGTEAATTQGRIPAMSRGALARVRSFEEALRNQIRDGAADEVVLPTQHVLHGGMYARTICLPAGHALAGVQIRVPTILIVHGYADVNLGATGKTLRGYHVLAGSAGRAQAIYALEDTYLTMLFPTSATSVEEAEEQFTAEAHRLASRQPGAVNDALITGETPCLGQP